MSRELLQGSARPRSSACKGALVVCDDDDTLIRLRDYLVRSGMQTRATRRLADAWRPSSREGIVLLPDDFDTGEVTDGLSRTLERSPLPFIIIVTAWPRFFQPLIQSLGDTGSVVLMPKPVWGWTILDLLRAWGDKG